MKLPAVICLFLILTGCSSFKPVKDDSRMFILVSQTPARAPTPIKGLGVGRVEIPDYLRSKAIAIREGSEIKYSRNFFWGENLDAGIQRTLAADLGLTNVFRSFWRRDQVAFEIYVGLERFELDETGTANLKAYWRIANPGASAVTDSGIFETKTHGPRLSENPAAAVVSLSDTIRKLTEEICRHLDLAQGRQSE